MYGLYRSITYLASPLMPRWLEKRRRLGKENAERLPERFGHTQFERPKGKLLWVHAASVGESNAALPLIEQLLTLYPALHVLLTTGTVTSAELMAKRLPEHAIHQFVPIDTPQAVRRFMLHWRPDVALFIDSELWPNLIMDSYYSGAIMGLVNARMSERSFHSWKKARFFIRPLLSRFNLCFAQSDNDAERLRKLGIARVNHIGNLKYDVPPLACDEKELIRLTAMIKGRPVWLAASTHAGEEEQIAEVHEQLKTVFPDLLTIIAPRHADRGPSIALKLGTLSVARRSHKDVITPATELYLADTMGELGLFYRLANIAFIGGSLVKHGGQNPIEALHLGCAVITGPHRENFYAVYDAMLKDEACIAAADSKALAQSLENLLKDGVKRANLSAAGHTHAKAHLGTLQAIVSQLAPYLDSPRLAQ